MSFSVDSSSFSGEGVPADPLTLGGAGGVATAESVVSVFTLAS
jgi:hypothetical protein